MENVLNEKIGVHDSVKIACLEKGLKLSDVLSEAGVEYATFQTWKKKEPNCFGQIHKLNQLLCQ